jgi:membrane protease subunit HflK
VPDQPDKSATASGVARATRHVGWILLVLAVIAYFCSGIYVVQPDERGLVRRFGRIVERNVLPGIHFAFPWPIDRVDKPKTTEVRRVTVGLSPEDAEAIAMGDIAAITRTLDTDILTGDENILKATMVVQYHIADVAQYLTGTAEPDALVASAVLAILIDQLGGLTVDDALTIAKGPLQTQVALLAQQRLDEYGAGVKILSTDLAAVDPPLAVIDAFKDVASAKKDSERSRDTAIAFRNQLLPNARGMAAERIAQAEGYHTTRVDQARGRADRFLAQLAEYRLAKEVTRDRLRLQTFDRILPKIKTYILDNRPNEPPSRLRLVE